MRVLLGPPGSGKTTRVLREFAQAAGAGSARLVVPTATMAEHFRHELVRQGVPVRPKWIQTMAGLVAELTPELRIAGGPELALVVSSTLDADAELFASVRGGPGLAAALASAIEELAYAGVGPLQLEGLANLRAAGLHPDLLRLYQSLEPRLEAAGLCLRAQALARAANRIADQDVPFSAVWFDGFFVFSAAEQQLLKALAGKTQITLTLPEWTGAAPLVASLRRGGARIEKLRPQRALPAVTLVDAPSRDHEAEEIVLRLVEEHRAGRPWREMGVVVRSEQEYLPRLERALLRAGVPARAYFGRPLWREPVCLMVRQFVEAVSSGWQGEAVLGLLRSPVLACAGLLESPDDWQRAVGRLPFSGLEALAKVLPQAAGPLQAFHEWPTARLTPGEWARRFPQLVRLLAAPPLGTLSQEVHFDFRLRAACFRSILDTLENAARLLPPEARPLADFWRSAEPALREARIFVDDGRRDVVHLLDVEEARQWELPVVFVCGLAEGEFPRRVQPDPVLPDALRLAMAQQGIGIRTRLDREAEEQFLYEVARTRATEKLYLSWPARNEKGDEMLRAFVLGQAEAEGAPRVQARRFLIRPSREALAPARPVLASEESVTALRQVHVRIAATAIESFLQCPFQFFARYTLGLSEPEKLPGERLDPMLLGTLAHETLKEWHQRGGDIADITEEMWDRQVRRAGVPETHQALLAREAMKRNLRLYAENARLQPGWQMEIERRLELELAGVRIHGRADRVDSAPDGRCCVYDFKYSSASAARQRTAREEEGLAVQGGLYAEALRQEGFRPEAIQVVSLKNEIRWEGAKTPEEAAQRMEQAVEAAATAIEKILAGTIEVRPADPDLCRWCSFRYACRVQEAAPEALAAAGGGDGP